MKKEFTEIGARIKSLRAEKNWTQPMLGSRVGCSKEYISELETGCYKPGNSMLIALSDTFRVPITDIDPDTDIGLKEMKL